MSRFALSTVGCVLLVAMAGALFAGCQTAPSGGAGTLEVTLVGSAIDPEDGELTGSALQWTQVSPPVEGVLGTGNTLTVTLEVAPALLCIEAVYQFRLTATDSQGQSREAVRTITLSSC